MPQSVLVAIATLLMLPGLAGVILPILPGLIYMLVVAAIFGVVDGFQHLQPAELGWLGLITLVSFAIDYLAGIAGARIGGANRRSLLAGTVGLVIGTFALPPLGGFIGLFVGILASELQQHGNRTKAAKAATSGLIGTAAGIAINFVLAILFLVLFVRFAL